jgi:hypothetical protein
VPGGPFDGFLIRPPPPRFYVTDDATTEHASLRDETVATLNRVFARCSALASARGAQLLLPRLKDEAGLFVFIMRRTGEGARVGAIYAQWVAPEFRYFFRTAAAMRGGGGDDVQFADLDTFERHIVRLIEPPSPQ